MKKFVISILTLATTMLIFGFTNFQVKLAIHNYQVSKGGLIYEYFSLSRDIFLSIPIVVVLYLVYVPLEFYILKRTKVLAQAFTFGILSYVLLALAFGFIGDRKIFWISMLPAFVAGFFMPLVEYWLTALLGPKMKK